MRVAVVGQGSIGRRHAELLLDLGHEVVAFDPDRSRIAPAPAEEADSVEAALDGADAAVIASPSSHHAKQARQAIERSVPVLVEKPLALDAAHAIELEWLARARGALLAVAMNLRHLDAVAALEQLVAGGDLGPTLRASAWCGSWLPSWRPGTDYRASYSARSELGGGVLLDVAVHELDYLLWLLGEARAVTAVTRRVSKLELDVEDTASLSLELASGALVDLVVDYFDRSYHRGCRIVGDAATAHWSWEDARIRVLGPAGVISDRTVSNDVQAAYRRQLQQFLAAVRGEAGTVVEASAARHVLAVIDAARASSSSGRRIELSPRLDLRRARPSDSAPILAWRNDPETRHWSRSTAEVTLEEHERWFVHVLGDPTTSLWLADSEGVPIGQVRVTQDDAGTAELHITLAPEARGRGSGATLLMEAAARALAEPGVQRLVAHVKPGNEASRRAFARAGFIPVGHDSDGLQRLERAASDSG